VAKDRKAIQVGQQFDEMSAISSRGLLPRQWNSEMQFLERFLVPNQVRDGVGEQEAIVYRNYPAIYQSLSR